MPGDDFEFELEDDEEETMDRPKSKKRGVPIDHGKPLKHKAKTPSMAKAPSGKVVKRKKEVMRSESQWDEEQISNDDRKGTKKDRLDGGITKDNVRVKRKRKTSKNSVQKRPKRHEDEEEIQEDSEGDIIDGEEAPGDEQDEDSSFEMDDSSFEIDEEEIDDSEKRKARKEPISDALKRKLLRDSREITGLRKELIELRSEVRGLENEVEYIEKETEKLRSEREGMEDDINKKAAIINALEKKLNRTQKDFEGYKGRIHQEIDRKALMKMKKMVLGVIEIIDNFDRAIVEGKKYDTLEGMGHIVDGMESIKRLHSKLLLDNNIEVLEPGEIQFDPNLHEAIEALHDPSKNDNTIIKVESNGYMLDGKVLKPARVVVSKGGPPWPKKQKGEKKGSSDEDDGSEGSKEDGELDDLSEMEDIDDLEEIEELLSEEE